MLELQTGLNLGRIEGLIRTTAVPNKNDIVLKRKYESKDFFSVVSLAQVVVTWLRKHSEARIIIPFTAAEIEQADPAVLRDFVREEINYVAIISGWPKIYSSDDEDVMFKIQEHTRYMRGIINSIVPVDWRAQKGNAMFLPCFDQYAQAGGHVNSFYYAPNKFYALEEFIYSSPFAHRLSHFLKSFNFGSGVRTFQDILEDLYRIVYELMLNTHQWARTDGNNRVLNPNSRGVYLKMHKAPPKSFQEEFKDIEGVNKFFNPKDFSLLSTGEMYALEISVFDSGPGYVKRFLSTNQITTNTAENVKIIKRCLCRHTTSARGGARVVKGMGLDKVMELLSDGKGLFRIRSEDSAIYRNMKSHPYEEFANSDDIEVFDWQTGSSTNFTKMPSVEGAVFSILYPLS